jgi:glutathione S-transferase
MRARAGSWMDWQISVAAPAVTPVFWGLVRTPPEKRDAAAIEAGKVKSMAAMKILDAQLAKGAFVAGDALSMGDIPVALMAYRFRRLVPERPGLDNLERWFTAIEQRPAFKEHVLAIPFV